MFTIGNVQDDLSCCRSSEIEQTGGSEENDGKQMKLLESVCVSEAKNSACTSDRV